MCWGSICGQKSTLSCVAQNAPLAKVGPFLLSYLLSPTEHLEADLAVLLGTKTQWGENANNPSVRGTGSPRRAGGECDACGHFPSILPLEALEQSFPTREAFGSSRGLHWTQARFGAGTSSVQGQPWTLGQCLRLRERGREKGGVFLPFTNEDGGGRSHHDMDWWAISSRHSPASATLACGTHCLKICANPWRTEVYQWAFIRPLCSASGRSGRGPDCQSERVHGRRGGSGGVCVCRCAGGDRMLGAQAPLGLILPMVWNRL